MSQRPGGRGRAFRIAWALAVGLAAATPGCALLGGGAGTPDPALERALGRAAAALPGFSPEASAVVVPAGSPQEGWKELARIRSQGPSPLSRQLGEAFAESRGEARDLVVGGPHAPLTERVLLDAFALSRAPRLPGLRVLLVTPQLPSEDLRAAAEELGVELLYRRLPEHSEDER